MRWLQVPLEFCRKGRHQYKIIQIHFAQIIKIGNKEVVLRICGIKRFLGNTCMWLKSFNQAFPGGQYMRVVENQAFPGGQYMHVVENQAFPDRQYMRVIEKLQSSISWWAIHAWINKARVQLRSRTSRIIYLSISQCGLFGKSTQRLWGSQRPVNI